MIPISLPIMLWQIIQMLLPMVLMVMPGSAADDRFQSIHSFLNLVQSTGLKVMPKMITMSMQLPYESKAEAVVGKIY